MSGKDERRNIPYCVCGNNYYYYVIYDDMGDRVGFINMRRVDSINPVQGNNQNARHIRRVLLQARSFKCGSCARVFTRDSVVGRELYNFGEKYFNSLLMGNIE